MRTAAKPDRRVGRGFRVSLSAQQRLSEQGKVSGPRSVQAREAASRHDGLN
jgi:hypothetical protein